MLDNHSDGEKCNCPNCNPRLQFNEEDVYNYQIKPLLQKAKEIAMRNGLPILMATCYAVKKDDGVVKVLVDAGGAGREDWAPHSFVVARRLITAELKGELTGSGMIEIDAAKIGAQGGASAVGAAILGHILGNIVNASPDDKEDDPDA